MDSENLAIENKSDEQSPCHWHNLKRELTPKGNYYDFEMISKDKYFLRWGNKSFTRVLLDTLYCDSPVTARPGFEDENDKYLVLRFGCGSPCWAGIFLPLNNTHEPKKIYYYYDFDLTNNLVASLELDEDRPVVCIDNLMTQTKSKFKIDYPCESAVPTFCMDSLSVKGKKLYYKWRSDFRPYKIHEKTIKLDSLF